MKNNSCLTCHQAKKNFQSDLQYLTKASEFLFDNVKSDFENSLTLLKDLNSRYKSIIANKPLTNKTYNYEAVTVYNNNYEKFPLEIFNTEVISKNSTSLQPYLYKVEVKPALKKDNLL